MNNRRRIFFGIALSSPLRKRLLREMVKWPEPALILTREENLHVTLYYLGFVHQDELSVMKKKVEKAIHGIPSFTLHFDEISMVPAQSVPKMIYLSGKPNPELLKLQEAVEKVFSPYMAAKKSYRPHATLAKVRRNEWTKLSEVPDIFGKVNFVEEVDTLVLFESVVLDGKRRYEIIESFSLQ